MRTPYANSAPGRPSRPAPLQRADQPAHPHDGMQRVGRLAERQVDEPRKQHGGERKPPVMRDEDHGAKTVRTRASAVGRDVLVRLEPCEMAGGVDETDGDATAGEFQQGDAAVGRGQRPPLLRRYAQIVVQDRTDRAVVRDEAGAPAVLARSANPVATVLASIVSGRPTSLFHRGGRTVGGGRRGACLHRAAEPDLASQSVAPRRPGSRRCRSTLPESSTPNGARMSITAACTRASRCSSDSPLGSGRAVRVCGEGRSQRRCRPRTPARGGPS